MNLMSIYSTPFWQAEYPEFEENKEIILNACKQYREENPNSDRKSNVSGYQSPKFLHAHEDLLPLFNYICSVANSAANDLNFIDRNIFITGSWVNYNETRQAMNSQHVHGDVFSGVFYVKTPEGSGKLVITNSGVNALWMGYNLTNEKNQFTAESVKIEPKEGQILLWPSYLPHSVETNDHDDERISISFNIIMFPKEEKEE
jgi:uncharacterized protein (TIGR02466 family)